MPRFRSLCLVTFLAAQLSLAQQGCASEGSSSSTADEEKLIATGPALYRGLLWLINRYVFEKDAATVVYGWRTDSGLPYCADETGTAQKLETQEDFTKCKRYASKESCGSDLQGASVVFECTSKSSLENYVSSHSQFPAGTDEDNLSAIQAKAQQIAEKGEQAWGLPWYVAFSVDLRGWPVCLDSEGKAQMLGSPECLFAGVVEGKSAEQRCADAVAKSSDRAFKCVDLIQSATDFTNPLKPWTPVLF